MTSDTPRPASSARPGASEEPLTLVGAVGVGDRRRDLEDVDGEVTVHVLQLLRVEHDVDGLLAGEGRLHQELALGTPVDGDRAGRGGRG